MHVVCVVCACIWCVCMHVVCGVWRVYVHVVCVHASGVWCVYMHVVCMCMWCVGAVSLESKPERTLHTR